MQLLACTGINGSGVGTQITYSSRSPSPLHAQESMAVGWGHKINNTCSSRIPSTLHAQESMAVQVGWGLLEPLPFACRITTAVGCMGMYTNESQDVCMVAVKTYILLGIDMHKISFPFEFPFKFPFYVRDK
jgi:hypothetical protein